MQGFNLEASVLQGQRERARPRNPRVSELSTSLRRMEMLASCAGFELHTVGLELLVINQMGKDGRHTASLLPFSGIPRKCTPPYRPPPLNPACYNPWLPPPPSRFKKFTIDKKTNIARYRISRVFTLLDSAILCHIIYRFLFLFFFYWIKQLWSLSGPCPTFSPRKKKSVMNFLTLG